MPFTVVCHSESEDGAAAMVNLAGTPDDHVTVTGDDIFVPDLNQVIFAAAIVDGTVDAQARLTSPSLIRRGHEFWIAPVNLGLIPSAVPRVSDLRLNPLLLDVDEALQAQVLDNPGSAVQRLVFTAFADGSPQPITGQEIRTVRCTAAVAQAVNVWTNGALTFPVSLQAGRYAVVGARCMAPNASGFRLRFQGSSWRPGGLTCPLDTDFDWSAMRYGGLGVWGEFDHRAPPTIDVIGVTNTAQEVFLDLIYLGA